MPDKIVDASALAALLFDEPEGRGIAERIQGATLYAPEVLAFELANVAWKKARRNPDESDALRAALDSFALLGVDTIPVEIVPLLGLSLRTGLSAFDASYLLLARTLKVDLVTLDARLAAAAAATGEAFE